MVVGQPHCAFGWALEAVLFGCQDISPSVIEQILVSLKLLLLLQALCHGYKPALKMLRLDGILWQDKFLVAESHLILIERHVIAIL